MLVAAGCAGGYSNPPLGPQGLTPTPFASPPSLTPTPTPASTPAPSVAAAIARATYIGRVWHLDPNTQPDHVMLSWAGVAAGVHFFGTELSMQVNPGTAGQKSWFNVTVDGNVTASFLVDQNSSNVTVAGNLPAAEHTLWLTKRTEASIGVVELDHFVVSAGGNFLQPPIAPAITLEVIGASAEVGFGVLGQDCNAYDADNFEDETLAWGHDTAQLLGTAESNLSFSGYGLLASGTGPVATGYTLQDLFGRTDPFIVDSPWDTTAHPVDTVLFDLGANDYNYFDGVLPNNFTSSYVSFVQQAITAYPKAQIYIVLSPTIADPARTVLDTAYQNVIAALPAAAAAQVHYYAFAASTGGGCYDHPLPDQHAQMAAQIAAQIRSHQP